MDEKKEKKSMKNNLEYFWMYYKLPFIAGMIVVILAMYFLITTLTTKDTALSVMLIDCHTEMSGEEMAEEYMDTAVSYTHLDVYKRQSLMKFRRFEEMEPSPT